MADQLDDFLESLMTYNRAIRMGFTTARDYEMATRWARLAYEAGNAHGWMDGENYGSNVSAR